MDFVYEKVGRTPLYLSCYATYCPPLEVVKNFELLLLLAFQRNGKIVLGIGIVVEPAGVPGAFQFWLPRRLCLHGIRRFPINEVEVLVLLDFDRTLSGAESFRSILYQKLLDDVFTLIFYVHQ